MLFYSAISTMLLKFSISNKCIHSSKNPEKKYGGLPTDLYRMTLYKSVGLPENIKQKFQH